MIKSISIHALKSIKDLTVKCSAFTVFVGTNSSGKSTIIQSLLLIAQNSLKYQLNGLNGPLVKLGSFTESFSNFCSKQDGRIRISVENDNDLDEVSVEIKGDSSDDVLASVAGGSVINQNQDNLIFNKKFYYLSCNRIGVQRLYENKNSADDKFGIYGENSYGYLFNHKNDTVPSELLKSQKSNTLLSQVNYWLNYIVNADMSVEEVPNTTNVKVLYSIGKEQIYRSPINVGSGLSYIASILIICLASEKHSTLVIENPEIHLHPALQAKFMETLAKFGGINNSFFIETHSEHMLRKLQVLVKKNVIAKDEVAVYYFKNENGTFSVSKHDVDERGFIQPSFPKEFYDTDLELALELM